MNNLIPTAKHSVDQSVAAKLAHLMITQSLEVNNDGTGHLRECFVSSHPISFAAESNGKKLAPIMTYGLGQASPTDSEFPNCRYWLDENGILTRVSDDDITIVGKFLPAGEIQHAELVSSPLDSQIRHWGGTGFNTSLKTLVKPGLNCAIAIREIQNGLVLESPNSCSAWHWVSDDSESNFGILNLDRNKYQHFRNREKTYIQEFDTAFEYPLIPNYISSGKTGSLAPIDHYRKLILDYSEGNHAELLNKLMISSNGRTRLPLDEMVSPVEYRHTREVMHNMLNFLSSVPSSVDESNALPKYIDIKSLIEDTRTLMRSKATERGELCQQVDVTLDRIQDLVSMYDLFEDPKHSKKNSLSLAM